MPERSPDTNGLWMYPTVYPGAEGKLNVNAVKLSDGLVEAVGLDGRFMGALRPFPGMGDVTIHGIPTPSGSTTITSISNILLVKYAAVQKGLSRHTLKGLVYIADNQLGTGKAVYFAYRDSSDGSTDVRMLEDLVAWTDFELSTVEDYDITSMGKYIYVSFSGDSTSTVTSFDDKQAPYNKAYYWDFKINDWDGFTTGFRGRFMGLLPERLLATPINSDSTTGGLDSSDMMRSEVYSPPGTDSDMPNVDYTYAVQLLSRKHGLRSYLRMYTLNPGVLAALRYRVSGLNPVLDYAAFVQQIRGNTHESTVPIQWGISHFDGFRLYRTAGDDLGMPTNEYSPVFPLHVIDEYLEYGTYPTGSSPETVEIDHDIDPAVLGNLSATVYTDSGLNSQPQFDPFLDVFGPAPRFRRIAAYDGLLVGVTDAKEPTTFSDKTQVNEFVPESIAWSTLVKAEPENFPPENVYNVDDPAERFFALVPVGDALFGVTNASIYRVARSGSTVGINRLQYRLGGVSRYGQVGVGNSLFILTTSGLKEVDGSTGEVRSVTAFDRIALDDSEWAPTLTSVFVDYDAKIGALVLLNTSLHEVYLLWEATGAVTKLVDVPWTFLTSGPEALTDGPHRCYFVTGTGQVHAIDGARDMGKRSMCGTGVSETVNGTISSSGATITDSTATFPANCEGFKVYMLSGVRAGESATIVTRNSDTQLTVSGLSGQVEQGDRYSIAPVITRVTLPQLWGQGGDTDPFCRKTLKSVSAAFSDLAGEYNGVNGTVFMGAKDGAVTVTTTEVTLGTPPDQVVGAPLAAAVRLFPFLEFKGGNLDFELQAVLCKGILGMSEAQSRQGT